MYRNFVPLSAANGKAWPRYAGYYSNQSQTLGNVATWELRRNVGIVHATGGAITGGAPWTAPSDHRAGHYMLHMKRGTPVRFRESTQGHGSYIVYRPNENGYPTAPAADWGVAYAGSAPLIPEDDPHMMMWLGQALSRMAWKTEELSGLADRLAGWVASHKVAWDALYDMDPARPMRASVMTHADVNLDQINNFPSMVTGVMEDSRFAPWVRYWVPGNELDNFGNHEGGNLGAGLVTSGFMGAYKTLASTVGMGTKVCSPTSTIIAPFALQTQRDFFVAAKAAGITFAARPLHLYNAELGDLRRGRFTFSGLMADHMHPDLGLASTPLIFEEAGTFFADEYRAHVPLRQAFQVMLQIFLGEVYAGVHGLFSKEMRVEFHPTPGFADYPSQWENLFGPYPVACQVLVHSQELFGCSQMVEKEFVTDDPDHLIGAVHRRANGTGVLALLSDGHREHEVRVRIPGAAGQTRVLVNGWGESTTVLFDDDDVAVVMADGRVTPDSEHWGRPALYVRLLSDDDPTFVANPGRGFRLSPSQVNISLDSGTTDLPRSLAAVKDRAQFVDSLALLNVGNLHPSAQSSWRTAESIEEVGGEFRILLGIPMLRVRQARINPPAPWQHMGCIRRAFLEGWVGDDWVPVGEIDETAKMDTLPIRTAGDYVSCWDDLHDGLVYNAAGVVTNLLRWRITDVTYGSAPTEEASFGLGLFLPTTRVKLTAPAPAGASAITVDFLPDTKGDFEARVTAAAAIGSGVPLKVGTEDVLVNFVLDLSLNLTAPLTISHPGNTEVHDNTDGYIVDEDLIPVALTTDRPTSDLSNSGLPTSIPSEHHLWLANGGIEVWGTAVGGGGGTVSLPDGWTSNPTGLYTFGG